MAKIHEEIIIIKISTLLPDDADMDNIMDHDNIQALEQIVKEFAGDNRTLVEIEKANN
jgi:hypothetical protein